MRDKRAKFLELARARVTRATETIRLIGNLANPSNYTYSADEAQKIVASLDQELKLLRAKFQAGLARRPRQSFKFD